MLFWSGKQIHNRIWGKKHGYSVLHLGAKTFPIVNNTFSIWTVLFLSMLEKSLLKERRKTSVWQAIRNFITVHFMRFIISPKGLPWNNKLMCWYIFFPLLKVRQAFRGQWLDLSSLHTCTLNPWTHWLSKSFFPWFLTAVMRLMGYLSCSASVI